MFRYLGSAEKGKKGNNIEYIFLIIIQLCTTVWEKMAHFMSLSDPATCMI